MNAKKELRDHFSTADNLYIRCAFIERRLSFDNYTKHILKQNYTSKDLENFLESLDFEYDDGWGSQELHGKVWLLDGTWLERREYDGSEWWVHVKQPEIPRECLESSDEEIKNKYKIHTTHTIHRAYQIEAYSKQQAKEMFTKMDHYDDHVIFTDDREETIERIEEL